jgi:hypothetical protein
MCILLNLESGDKYTKETKNFYKNEENFITVIISCQLTRVC